MPPVIHQWEGVNNLDGVYPPDTDGEVGKDHYIQMVNLHTAIYDKTGTLLYGPFAPNLLWPSGDICRLQNDGDPVVLFDQFANRWILSQFALPNYPSGPFYECFAISKTNNPTNVPSDWYLYTFQVHNSKMDDYPKIAVWPDAYYMTDNQFASGSGDWAGAGVFAFDRAKMVAGQAATFQYFDLYTANSNYGGMLPGDLDGSTPPPAGSPGLFFEVDDNTLGMGADAMRIWKFHVDWNTPANSTFGVGSSAGVGGQPNSTLPVASFDYLPCTISGARTCIPQSGTSQKLDAIGDRLMFRAVYRNFGDHDAVLLNHTVLADGADRAGIRWYEVRDLFGTPTIYQQGTYAPADGAYRWMGSLAFDHVGNIALGYSVSSSSMFPSIRYAGRLVSDPLGTLPQDEVTVIAGTGAQTGTGARWGDYSAMSVDPVDDCTLYYTQEYIQTTGSASWQTRVASFKFPSCSIGPQGTLQGKVVKQSNPSEGISGATVTASASLTQTVSVIAGADGSFRTPLPVGTYSVTASAYAYMPGTVNGVSVTENVTTTLPDIALTAAPSYNVQGVVKDAHTGWPLYAKIEVGGAPIDPIWTNPQTGAYNVNLLGGTAFNFKTTTFWGGYADSQTTVGPLSSDVTQDIFLSPDVQTCSAPGYKMHGMLQTFDATSLPAGWTVQHLGGSCDWSFNNPGGRANLTGGSGNFAIADSDACGTGTTMSTVLVSPKVDVSTLSQIMLSFKYDYNNLVTTEVAKVEVSADGTTWNTVVNWGTADMRGPATYTQDVTSLLSGSSEAQVRFTYTAPGWDWWWEVDDVFLGLNDCSPQSGGLVVGSVKDINTNLPLPGATVENGALSSTQAVSTPLDPAVADAFYTLFAPAGSQPVSASMPLYETSSTNVSVPLSGTVQQDFALGAGILTYAPAYMTVTVPGGANTTLPLTITNSGAVTATFTLNEVDAGFLPYGPFEKPPYVVKPFRQQNPTSQGGGVSNPPTGAAWTSSQLLGTWALPSPANPWGLAFNSQSGKLWIGDSWAPTGSTIQEFTPSGGFTRKEWAYDFNTQYGPADAAYNLRTGSLWVMGVRSDHENCIYEINPQSGPTGRKICPGFSTTQRGLAYDPVTDTYFAGSWTDQSIHRFTSDGKLLSSRYVGLNISGLAYNATTHHLFVATSAGTTRFFVLDEANNYANLGEFQVTGFNSYGGAGLEMDCSGNLWAIDQAGKTLYQVASGEMTRMCNAVDLAWVNESPAAGQLGPGKQQVVNVNFNGNVSPGIYMGQLHFQETTPYPVANLPLKLNVQVSPTQGKVAGTLSTLGTCDVNPAVLAGKPVTIKSFDGTTWNLTTDSQGAYGQWLDQVHSPVTVTATVAGYQPGSYTNVAVVGMQTVTKDFTLRTLQPCVSITPPTLAVTLTLGQDTSRSVRVTNSGAGTAVFTTTESSLGFIPGMPALTPDGNAPLTNPLLSLAGPQVEKVAGPYAPGDVNLVIDDGTSDNSIGLTSGGDFVWANRFTPAAGSYPFTLKTVSMVFPSTTPTGSAIELVVYEDADGDPINGATFKYSQNVTVQNNDGVTWNVYTLTSPVLLNGPSGDVLIGAVNRGATDAGQYPASIDQTTLQRRSWIGLYSSTVPDPPTLPADDTWGIIDDLASTLAGNWMIRGAGTAAGGTPVQLDWLTETPTQSTVLADTFQWINVGFDASKVALPGQYKAMVNFNTNDSHNKWLPVNVTMNVIASALWGQMQGSVQASDRCDANPALAAGATVTITGTDGVPHTITTDANGHYLIWLSSGYSPYSVTASMSGYLQDSAAGQVVDSGGAMTNVPTLTMRKNAPCVDKNPAGVSISLPWGGTGSQNLGLTNTGAVSSLFTITEQAGGFTPMDSTPGKWLLVTSGTSSSDYLAITPILTALGYTFDYQLYSTFYSSRTVPNLLTYQGVLWLGSGLYESSSYASNVTLMKQYLDAGGRLFLAYYDEGYYADLYPGTGFYPTYLQATYKADSGSKGLINGADIMSGVSIDLSAASYPDSIALNGANAVGLFNNTAPRTDLAGLRIARNTYKAVYLAFSFYQVPSAGTARTQTLQKALEWLTASGPVDVLPWLTETPITGTLSANTGSQTVVLGFDAGVPAITQPGTYTGVLKVANQDSGNTPLSVPVTMTVGASATQGKLNGTVTGLQYCDVSPGAPLKDALVQIRGGAGISITLKTDAAGYYQRWLDTGAYTVTVTTASYVSQAVTNISLPVNTTTTQNFALRWLKACVNANPGSLAATVALGANTTQPFTLTNLGPASTAFKITEVEGGFTPVQPQAGADVLVVNEITADAAAMEAALTALGYSYDEVTNTTYTGMSVSALLTYKAVLYAGVISSGAEQTQTIAYLDAGGRLLLASEDEGYFYSSSVFYATYLQASYGTDSGSKGTITGQDIMAGVNTSIASAYPDNFTIIGADAVGIFHNDLPNTNWAGLRIARNTYRAVYLAWNFQYTNGTADTATKQTVMSNALGWLAPPVDVPWLSAAPATGSLAADTGQQVITATLDAAQVNQPGVYTAALKVKTDDPVNTYRIVPVTMTVPIPAGYGKLSGTVYSLGACDLNPAPLANAAISLTDGSFNWTTTTDGSGYYQFWVGTTSPLTITASAAVHQGGQAVVAVPASSTLTQNFNLHWLKPCLNATPGSMSAYQTLNVTTTQLLYLDNSGLISGTFSITPHTSGFLAVKPQLAPRDIQTSVTGKSPVSKPTTIRAYPTAPRPAAPSATLINDGSFEGTAWTEVDDTFCTPWIGDWSSIIGITAFDGAQYFWAGGYCGAANSNSAAQNISLPADAQSLTFWYQALRTDADDVTNGAAYVKVNGTTIWSLPMVLASNTAAWTQVSVDISAYAGQNVELKFGADQAGTGVGNVTFDYVEVSSGGSPGGSGNWLSVNPASGSVTATTSSLVEVIFDSRQVAQPGVYTGNLEVSTNTPVYNTQTVPVTMTIGVPANWGKLTGVVTQLGYCDINPLPLANTKLTIQGTGGFTATVMTAADGSYQYWMPIGAAPLTVTANGGASYEVKTASNVALGASPTTLNFNLRSYQACVSSAPTSYNVTIVRGNTLTSSLTLHNNGALGTGYELAEVDGGFVPNHVQPAPRQLQVTSVGSGLKSPLSKPGTLKYYPSGYRPAAASATLINDGSFEGAAWTEVDDTGCTPWIGDWSSILGITAYDGAQYFWAGGFCGSANSNSAAQNISLPADAQTLSFWYQSLRNDPDDVTNGAAYVKINGTTVWSLPMVLASNTSAWTQVVVNVSAYAGQNVELKFGADQAGTGVGNVTFDYVEVSNTGFSDNVPWLSETPITGTLTSDGSQNGLLLFDTAGLVTGVYSATLNVNTADPQNPTLPIPVTMNVITPTYALTVASSPIIVVGDRGIWVTHVVTVTNTGDDPYGDTFNFSHSGNTWVTNVSPASADLMPNQSTTATVDVFIPAGVMPAAMDDVTFEAESAVDPAASAQLTLTSVARSYAPLLTPPTSAQSVVPGSIVTYTLHLVNPSNTTETFTLAASGNVWQTQLSQTVVTLGAGQTADIVVKVTTPFSPPSAPTVQEDTVTIKATSLDPTMFTQATLTTTLQWFFSFLPMTLK